MQPDQTDIELWNAFRNGQTNAFEQLFRRYYPSLLLYGTKLGGEVNIAEDCIQDLFIELWKSRSTIQVHAVKPYLFKALKYKIFKAIKSNHNHGNIDLQAEDLPFEISHESAYIERIDNENRNTKIAHALQKLSNRQREIIYLKVHLKLSYEEISEIMHINYQVCRNLFSQSIKNLRKIINNGL